MNKKKSLEGNNTLDIGYVVLNSPFLSAKIVETNIALSEEASSKKEHNRNVSPYLLSKQVEVDDESPTHFAFSSATSLDSSMTLVSGAADLTEAMLNRDNGTREKRFEDGRVEFWYSNGNR